MSLEEMLHYNRERIFMTMRWDKLIVVGFVLVFLAPGCKDSEIKIYRLAKDDSAMAPHHMESASAEMETSPSQHQHSSGQVHWSLPKDWQELPVESGSMRLASFRTAAVKGSSADVSVVVLPGTAGGLLANVNRWRGQIGLEPIDEASFKKSSQKILSPAGSVILVDFSAATSRIAAGTLETPEQTWFFKLTGSVEAVGQAKPSFLKFLESLHHES